MDPIENNIEYSEESQNLIDQNNDLFDALKQQQEEEEEAAAAQAQQDQQQQAEAQAQADVNPVQQQFQQAADSTGQGLGQIADAIGGAIQGITRDRTEEEDAERVAGQGGQVRDVAGAVGGVIEELSNDGTTLENRNLFQQAQDALAETLGLRTVEESQELREEGVAQGQELKERIKDDAGFEPIRAVQGSVLGAAESTLEFAELVGDVSKTLASKANIVGYDPKDDPFSDQYNWASWSLGKDELGAQTPVGKIAQGFGEFAVVFMGTGGGSATANLFRGGATGAGAVARTAGREALEGVLADVVMSASGEGNLSNLIKENAPDWYPTWLEALAIDEDDNPFEAAFKTAFEGGLLGAPVGAATAYLKGARAVRKAQKANPKATQAELQQVAYEAIQGELNLGIVAKPPKKLEALDVYREMTDGDFSRAAEVSPQGLRDLMNGYELSDFVAEKDILNAFPFQTTMEALGKGTINTKLPNGSNIEWIFSDAAGPTLPSGAEYDAVRIDWNIDEVDAKMGGLGEGAAGIKMFSRVRDAVRQADLAPGTIIQVEAAEDGFGAKGVSAAQGRAAWSKNSNRNKAAKKWISDNEAALQKQYLEDIGQTDPEYWTGLDMQAKWDHFDGRQVEGVEPFKAPASEKSIRQRLYERAGFSEPDADGGMWGIVKKDKSGRRIFEPLDVNGDVDEQIAAARTSKDFQPNLDFRYHDKQALDTLEGLKAEDIPHTWDDVAAVMPDLFIPGTRDIGTSGQFHPDAMKAIMDLDPTDFDGGATVHPFTGEVPTSGTMVAVDGATLDNLDDPEAIAGFIARYQDILSREDAYLGAWVSKETGKPVVEISRLVQNYDEAVQIGRIFDQEGVFRLDDFHYEPTGGLDQLKYTQGAHLRSISSRAPEPKPVDAQTAASQTVQGEQALSPQTGVQNVLTSQQVRRLATAGDERTGQILEEINNGMDINISELADEANLTELEIVQDAATKLGDDFGFLASDVSKLEFNEEGYLSRTGIVQSRMVMKELAARIARTSFNVNDASARGMSQMAKLDDMITSLKTFMKTYKISANLNSKRLSAGAIELPPEFGLDAKQIENLYGGDAVEGLTKSFDQSTKMLDELQAGLKGNNPKARRKALQIANQLELVGDNPFKLAQNATSLRQVGTKVALKIMYNSMLSSPATHIINGTSNFIAAVLRPAAAAAGGDIKAKKAAMASFHALHETIFDALDMAGKKWKQHDTDAKGAITSDGEASLMLDELEARAEASGDESFQAGVSALRMIDDIANFFDLPSRMLTTADEFFKTATQRMEYNRMIMEEAIDINGSDTQAIFEDLLKKKRSLNFTKSGDSLNAELNRVAKEVTFQTDLEGPAKRFGEWVNEFPAMKIFFPFVRTGHNVAKYTASYVPVLAQAMEKLDGGFDFATLPPYEQAIIKGRQRLGTAFIASVGLMASQGMITGNGPMDPEAKKRWLEQNQPRSIKLGDTFISLDRVEPFGPILSAVADIWYAFNEGEMKMERAQWMAGYLAAAIGTNITDRTFFSGFQDFAKILNPRNAGSYLIGTGADTLNNFIPAAGLRRTLTNMMTPYMQEFNEVWDRTLFQSGIGAGVASNATRYDFITGEPVSSTSGGINALLPFKFNTKKQDPVKQALYDIEFNSDQIVEELGQTGLKLTPEQISRLQQNMGNSDLHERLKSIVSRKDWKDAVKAYKEKLRGGHRVTKTSQPFYKEIKDVITDYADYAMWELKQDYPELQESLDDYRRDLNADKYGGLTEFYQQ